MTSKIAVKFIRNIVATRDAKKPPEPMLQYVLDIHRRAGVLRGHMVRLKFKKRTK